MERLESGKFDKYSSLRPVYSMNILGYNHFTEGNDEDALRIFTLYDIQRNKSFGKDLISIGYFELLKKKVETQNQGYWRDFFLTGVAPKGAPSYIEKAAGLIEYSNLDEEERKMIDLMEKAQADIDSQIVTAYDDGKTEGKREERYDIARNALAEGGGIEYVHRITGLDIQSLQDINATITH
jgi:hypothetical protein